MPRTLPDGPIVFAFARAYATAGKTRQIRIVFDDMPDCVPTALVSVTLNDAETGSTPASASTARPGPDS